MANDAGCRCLVVNCFCAIVVCFVVCLPASLSGWQVTDGNAADGSASCRGMHQQRALPLSSRVRIHGLEEEVDEVEEVREAKVEPGAREGEPMSRSVPVRALCQIEQMAKLVPSLAERAHIFDIVAVESAAAVELAKQAFLAIDAGARLAHSALLLLRADMPLRVRVCLLASLGNGCSRFFTSILPRHRRLFPGQKLYVYVAPSEHVEWLANFRRRGLGEQADDAGVILRHGGSLPGEQVQAALRDTAPQDHFHAKQVVDLT